MSETFDVVFKRTSLKHIWDYKKTFQNLAQLSFDIAIVVVPLGQVNHVSTIPDYWRFRPQSLNKLYSTNESEVIYSNYNNTRNGAIQLFYVGNKKTDICLT